MSKTTYQITVAARGEITVSGRRVAFDLKAGEHRPASADEELVMRELQAAGIARPAPKPAKAEKPKADAPAGEETGSVS